MLAAIAAARRWGHCENYSVGDGATGRRFADALVERARSGVRVRVLYEALGSFGTSRRYWRRLTQAGVEVRAFHPLLTRDPLDVFARDHRKLLVTDGSWAMTGGLCIGNEWAGDPARGRRPWRDTMVAVTGPAAAAPDAAFARPWRRGVPAVGSPPGTCPPRRRSTPAGSTPHGPGWTCASSSPARATSPSCVTPRGSAIAICCVRGPASSSGRARCCMPRRCWSITAG